MNPAYPPPLPQEVRHNRVAAIWSLSLAGFTWVSLLVLVGGVASNRPEENDKIGWFWIGMVVLILFAVLLTSIGLAISVFVRRKQGRALAIIALVLDALPFLVMVASMVRATFKPSNW